MSTQINWNLDSACFTKHVAGFLNMAYVALCNGLLFCFLPWKCEFTFLHKLIKFHYVYIVFTLYLIFSSQTLWLNVILAISNNAIITKVWKHHCTLLDWNPLDIVLYTVLLLWRDKATNTNKTNDKKLSVDIKEKFMWILLISF